MVSRRPQTMTSDWRVEEAGQVFARAARKSFKLERTWQVRGVNYGRAHAASPVKLSLLFD